MILVSACLTGECCKYSGKSNPHEGVIKYLRHMDEDALPVCPEQLGGLPTPRARAEIEGGAGGAQVLARRARVISETGEDLSEAFRAGAQLTLKQAREKNIRKAILKSKSPSCGCGYIYDGTFGGKLIPADGVTAALLIQNGIAVATEDQFSVLDH